MSDEAIWNRLSRFIFFKSSSSLQTNETVPVTFSGSRVHGMEVSKLAF